MTPVKCALGIVGALGLFASAPKAQATTLQDLLSGGTVTHGGETYSDFTVGGTLPASDVTVNFTDNGVQFTANWNTLTPGANSSVISYTVTAAPSADGIPNNISGAQLFFGGQVIINNGTASVGETLTDATHGKDYSMQVFYAGRGAANNNLRDSVTIDPTVASVRVVKSIDVAANGADSFASLNFVENTYSNVPSFGGAAPEPMSLALLPLALGGMALRRRSSRV